MEDFSYFFQKNSNLVQNKKNPPFSLSPPWVWTIITFSNLELLVQPADKKVSKTFKLFICLEILLVCLFPTNIILFYLLLFPLQNVFCFCPDFVNHPKHVFFWLKQKMVFDQNLESHLLYEQKKMWKVLRTLLSPFTKKIFFLQSLLTLIFKNKVATVILS